MAVPKSFYKLAIYRGTQMSAASRRRRWFATGFGHVGPLVRPRYKRRASGTLDKRLQERIAKEKLIASRKSKRK